MPSPLTIPGVRAAILGISGAFAPGSSRSLPQVDHFDAAFFRIAPIDAELMDPQQRLFLEHCWRAIQDSGQLVSSLAGQRVGVFAGTHRQDYLHLLQRRGIRRAQTVTGNAQCMIANRVSYLFDLRGSSCVYDAGAASGFVAIAHAFEALRNGECDFALAGAVNLVLDRETEDRREASDGCGVILLGRLDAIESEARIRALLLSAEARGIGMATNDDAGWIDRLSASQRVAPERFVCMDSGAARTETDFGAATGWNRLLDMIALLDDGKATVGLRGPDGQAACILEAAPRITETVSPAPRVIPLSGSTPDALRGTLLRAKDFFRTNALDTAGFRDAAYTLQTGRTTFPHRIAIVAESASETVSLIDLALTGEARASIIGPGSIPSDDTPEKSIARCWVEEGVADWQSLHAGAGCRRAAAPQQELAPVRFWHDSYAASPSQRRTATPITASAIATPSSEDVVLCRMVEPGIAVIILRDLEQRNMFSPALVQGIASAFEWIRREPSVRTVVITNDGPHFAMGGTRESLSDIAAGRYTYTDLPFLYEGMLTCPWPVIAAMRGNARGAGLIFGFYADVILMAEESSFSVNFMKFGITPGLGATVVLPFRLGSQLANEMMLTAASYTGAELSRKGAPLQFAPLDRLLDEAMKVARDIASRSPEELKSIKTMLSGDLLEKVRGAMPSEVSLQQQSFLQPEVQSLIATHLMPSPQSTPVTSIVPEFTPPQPASLDLRRIRLTPLGTADRVPRSLTRERVRLQPLPRRAIRTQSSAASFDGSTDSGAAARLANILASILHTEAQSITPDKPFADLGLDSVSGTEAIRDINNAFSLSLSGTVLYDHPNLSSLTSMVEAELAKIRPSARPAPVPPATAAPSLKVSSASAASHRPVSMPRPAFEPIAITGIAGRFPGASNIDQLWENLLAGRSSIGEPPSERGWDMDALFSSNPGMPGRSVSKWGGFLDHVDRFDPEFFSMSFREAELTSPEQRLFLMEAWNSLEDAGYSRQALSGSRCGVFVGCNQGDYPRIIGPQDAPHALSGLSTCGLASRISYLLNLRGPGMAIDTACSSSLVALNQACQSIHAGDCDLAIAGGVSLMLSPDIFILASKAGMLSPRGRIAAFDAAADGIVLAEAAAAVVLKPLANALRDRDQIWGVIGGIGINQDGKTNGISAPSREAQAELQTRVLERAGVHPESITVIEAHGTGTPLGDPIELKALERSYGLAAAAPCTIGSIKSNIGHANTAAGVVGLISLLLQLRHRSIRPLLHYSQPNPQSPSVARFRMATAPSPWLPDKVYPRRAAINSFGFTGTNAHAIIEESPEIHRVIPLVPALLFPVSGRSPEAVHSRIERLRASLSSAPKLPLCDVSFTLCAGRSHFAFRRAFVAGNREELIRQLSESLEAPAQLREVPEYEAATEERLHGHFERDLLSQIAGRWENGERVDLASLFDTMDVRRVSLPSYPFREERFWLKAAPVSAADKSAERKGESTQVPSRPLFGSSQPARTGSQPLVFTALLSPDSPIVQDHQVRHKAVFPGVGYLEAAFEAAELAGLAATSITGLRLLHPLEIAVPLALRLTLRPVAAGMEFETESCAQDATTIHHASGRLLSTPCEPLPPVSLDEIRARCSNHLAGDAVYERYSRIGVHYGTSFRTLQQVWGSSTEAIGELVAPLTTADHNTYLLPPSMLDGALQTIAGLVVSSDEERLHLPFVIEAIHRYAPIPSRCWAWVERSGSTSFDVTLLDNRGNTLVRLLGVVLRPFRDPLEGMFHLPEWQKNAVPTVDRPEPRNLLLIEPAEFPHWKTAIQMLHPRAEIVTVRLGDAAPRSDNNMHEYDRADADWAETLLDGLSDWSPDTVYHLGAVSAGGLSLATAEENGVLALFRLIKALDRRGYRREDLRLLVITNDVHCLAGASPIEPWAAALHGWSTSVAREFRRWDVSCIDLSLADLPSGSQLAPPPARHLSLWLSPAVTEAPEGEGMGIAIRERERWSRTLRSSHLAQDGSGVSFRHGGIYLIAGGTGGIGFQLSLYLSTRYQAKLVWLGRRPKDGDIELRMGQIVAGGGEVRYFQCELCDSMAVSDAVTQTIASFGTIHGAIHSALVLHDSSIQNMTEKHLRSVLDPKATGIVNLATALPPQLDFLMLFSSAQSFAGSAGQGNYAAACTFEDAYGQYLTGRGRRTVIINWGYWGTVGAVARPEIAERMSAAGIDSIEPSEGIEAIERILSSGLSQVLAMRAGDEVRVRLGLAGADRQAAQPPAPNNDELRRHAVSTRVLNRMAGWRLLAVLQSRGLLRTAGDAATSNELAASLGLHQKYTRLWRALLALLVRRGFLRADETRFVVLPKAAGSRTPGIIAALHEHQSSLLLRFPSLAPHLALLETCTAALPDVLQGTTSPVEVLFPRGSMERVEGIYKGNTLTDYWNRVCADTIVRAVEQRLRSGSGRTVTVLEVGAGTGATSRIVLDALKPFGTQVRFIYTDVSPRFVAHGRQFFGDLFPQAEFTVLDMEAPHSRSVEPSSVDILFATNALHASRDLRATLAGLSTLLRTGANIVINESTEPQDFATLTFGLTPGWWLFTDDSLRQPHSPLLSEAGWKSALATSGFGSVVGRGQSRAKTISPRQMIMEGVLLTTGRDKPAAVQLTPEPSSLPEIHPQHIEHDAVCLYVRQIFSDLLKSPINRFAGHATFESFGIDSLVSQEIIARFEQDLGPVPAVLLFEYRTINELASHLTTAYREPLLRLNVLRPSEVSQAPTVQSISPNPTSPPDSSGRLRQEVYALADHEVDALLERLLSRAG